MEHFLEKEEEESETLQIYEKCRSMILVTREAPGEIQLKVCDWDLTEHPPKFLSDGGGKIISFLTFVIKIDMYY